MLLTVNVRPCYLGSAVAFRWPGTLLVSSVSVCVAGNFLRSYAHWNSDAISRSGDNYKEHLWAEILHMKIPGR